MTEPRRTLNWPQVIGAACGGFVLEWCVIVGTFLVAAGAGYEGPTVVVIGFLALPLLCGLLLLFPRTRTFGASLFVGLLLGSIAGAGVCTGFLVSLQ